MTTLPTIHTLIVAAGTGTRAGGEVPKQYRTVGGKALLRYSVETLLNHPLVAGVVVVIHPDHRAWYEAATAGLTLPPPIYGGAERSDSVQAGLAALADHAPDYVLVHDAARPFLTQPLLDRLLARLSPDHAVVPALAVADTVRRFTHGQWQELPREGLLRIQTPQGFPFAALQALSGQATDEAALWLAAGHTLVYVEGDEQLRKVTTMADLAWAETMAAPAPRIAIGMGYDVHALMPAGDKRTIRLGGVDISHDHKLHGHSDADVVLHAITDAILGALAEGDIGAHFSPTDPRWKGADSGMFLREAAAKVTARGGVIQHIDTTVICESPKIGPHRDAMREAVAALLQLPIARVSIKATTTEKLGFTGRSEGIAAQAVATIALPPGDA